MKLHFQVSDPAQREITRLRKQAARFRVERNQAREELAALRAERV